MAQAEAVRLVVRGLGRAEVTLGDLSLVPGQGMLFTLALVLAQRAGEKRREARVVHGEAAPPLSAGPARLAGNAYARVTDTFEMERPAPQLTRRQNV